MSLLLDANAIVNAVLQKKTAEIVQYATLDLARYEVGKAFWKQVNVRKTMTLDEALVAARVADDLISLMEKRSVAGRAPEVLRLASQTSTSFYDAAYLFAAREWGMRLVTDDKKLLGKARNLGIPACASDELPNPQ